LGWWGFWGGGLGGGGLGGGNRKVALLAFAKTQTLPRERHSNRCVMVKKSREPPLKEGGVGRVIKKDGLLR